MSRSGNRDIARLAYDRIFAERAGREAGDQFDLAGPDEDGAEASLPQILNPSRYAPELAESKYRNNALAVARQLLGEGAEQYERQEGSKLPDATN